jgi:hypothetical protein
VKEFEIADRSEIVTRRLTISGTNISKDFVVTLKEPKKLVQAILEYHKTTSDLSPKECPNTHVQARGIGDYLWGPKEISEMLLEGLRPNTDLENLAHMIVFKTMIGDSDYSRIVFRKDRPNEFGLYLSRHPKIYNSEDENTYLFPQENPNEIYVDFWFWERFRKERQPYRHEVDFLNSLSQPSKDLKVL